MLKGQSGATTASSSTTPTTIKKIAAPISTRACARLFCSFPFREAILDSPVTSRARTLSLDDDETTTMPTQTLRIIIEPLSDAQRGRYYSSHSHSRRILGSGVVWLVDGDLAAAREDHGGEDAEAYDETGWRRRIVGNDAPTSLAGEHSMPLVAIFAMNASTSSHRKYISWRSLSSDGWTYRTGFLWRKHSSGEDPPRSPRAAARKSASARPSTATPVHPSGTRGPPPRPY